jgi:hypothetical protein
MKRKETILCFIAFLLIAKSYAQLHTLGSKQLSSFPRVVNAIVLDSRNRLWIGAENGLYYFDSSVIASNQLDSNKLKWYITLPENELKVSMLKSGKENDIWIGTYNQSLFNLGKNGKLIKYEFGDKNNKLIHDIVFYNNSVLVATEQGVYIADHESHKLLTWKPTNNRRFDLINKLSVKQLRVRDNVLYLATDYGLFLYAQNKITRHLKFGQVTAINFTDNLIWLSAIKNGVSLFYTENVASRRSNKVIYLKNPLTSSIKNIYPDFDRNKLLVLTNYLFIVDETDFSVNDTLKTLLQETDINCVLKLNQSLIIGTNEKGLYKIDYELKPPDIAGIFPRDPKKGISFDLPIRFDLGQDILNAEGKQFVKKLAEFLSINSNVKIQINGYTEEGPKDKNKKLSEGRALAVKYELINNYKIAEERITKIKGYGHKPENGKDNRRVEILIM